MGANSLELFINMKKSLDLVDKGKYYPLLGSVE